MISEAKKPLQLVGQAAEFKFESKFEHPAGHLAILPKAVPEGIRRFRGQNLRPSSWGSSQALLGRVGRASTNTGRFPVGGSRCGQQQARLRKTCYYSCDTDSVQEAKRFQCFVNNVKFGQRRVILISCKFGLWQVIFFSCETKFLMELARSCRRPKQRPSFRSTFDESVKINKGTKPHLPKRILWKAADILLPLLGKGISSGLNRTAQRLQMAARKSW